MKLSIVSFVLMRPKIAWQICNNPLGFEPRGTPRHKEIGQTPTIKNRFHNHQPQRSGAQHAETHAIKKKLDLWSAARPWSCGSSASVGLPTSMIFHSAHLRKQIFAHGNGERVRARARKRCQVSQPLRKDGKMILHIEQLHRYMDGFLEYCIFLDCFNTVILVYQATRAERIRYHSQHALMWH